MICLGCLSDVGVDQFNPLPLLLKGQFCTTCLVRMGFMEAPAEIDLLGDDDDYDDEFEYDDEDDVTDE